MPPSSANRLGRAPRVVVAACGSLLALAAVVLMPGGEPRLAWTAGTATEVIDRPAIANGLLAFCTQDGAVHVVDLDSGDERWTRDDRRLYATPAVVGGLVVAASYDGELVAFEAALGHEVWRAPNLGFVAAVEAVAASVAGAGSEQLLVGCGTGFQVLNAATGTRAWSHAARGERGDPCITETLAVADGVAYVGCGPRSAMELTLAERSVASGAVYAVDLETRAELWVAPVAGRVRGAPVVVGDVVVCAVRSGAADTVIALERKSGAVRWTHVGGVAAPRICAATVCFDGLVEPESPEAAPRVGDRDRAPRSAFLGVDVATGDEAWSRGFDGEGDQSLALGGLAVFDRGRSIHAVGGASGKPAWTLALDARVSAPLAAGEDHLVVFTSDRRVRVYRID